MFKNVDGGFVPGDSSVQGFTKPGFSPPSGNPADIKFVCADVGLYVGQMGKVKVFDVFLSKILAVTNASSFTIPSIAWMDTALLRLSVVSP